MKRVAFLLGFLGLAVVTTGAFFTFVLLRYPLPELCDEPEDMVGI